MRDATIEVVKEVINHPNADRLDICTVLGYKCITKRDQFKVGDKVIYVRPDSVFPDSEWAQEYKKYSQKRVKAVKLRDIWSEGIIIPFTALPKEISETIKDYHVGEDVSELLWISHYEPPTPTDISIKGELPYGIPVTDEERWENLDNSELPYGELVDIFLKIDGQSNSFYRHFVEKTFGVLGRKHELKLEISNNYTNNVSRYDIERKLTEFSEKYRISLSIRGESYGIGIQSIKINPHSKLSNGWAMFSVYLIDERRYARKGDQFYFLNVAKEMDLPTVKLVEENVILTPDLIKKYSEDLKELYGKPFEGVVVQYSKGSFKIINKHYDSNK